jgi:hypothetical protein
VTASNLRHEKGGKMARPRREPEEPPGLPVVECCPPLERDGTCDVIDFRYRLLHLQGEVPVEVTLIYRLERCPGPLTLGELVYTTTLLPGEKVRLFTTDRRTRFTFDSETNISHRSEQSSEEQFYMSSMADFMSDLTVVDRQSTTNTAQGRTSGHFEASSALESLFGGPSVDVSGSFSGRTTSDYARELRQHARASDRRSVQGARAASSVSIGEVSTRTHAEGTSEDHFESSSREFANPNRCRAVTFFFYRINKQQTVRWRLESIERRVVDQAADTKVVNNDFLAKGGISAVPDAILATRADRLEVEQRGRESVRIERGQTGPDFERFARRPVAGAGSAPPLAAEAIDPSLEQVDRELVAEGLLDEVGGEVAEAARERLSFEETSSLPTAGVIVKGCLDECDICEPELQERIKLELKLLERQIELLDKSQEYRCCPGKEGKKPDEDEDEDEDDDR